MLITFPNGISRNGYAPAILQVEVDHHIAHDIASNGHITPAFGKGFRTHFAASQDTDIGRIRPHAVVLYGTTGNGHFGRACPAGRTVNKHIGRRRRVLAHITLDITARNMEVPDIPPDGSNPSSVIIADMTTRYIRLMQVYIVVKYPNAPVFI